MSEAPMTPRTMEYLKRENGLLTDMNQAEMIKKMREDRVARERARIIKLRQMNLSKYNNSSNVITIKVERKSIMANRQSLLPKQISKFTMTKAKAESIDRPRTMTATTKPTSGEPANHLFRSTVTESKTIKQPIKTLNPMTQDTKTKFNIKSSIPKPQKLVKNREKKNFIAMNKHIAPPKPFVPPKQAVAPPKQHPTKPDVRKHPNMSIFERLSQPKHPREPVHVPEVRGKPVARRQTVVPRQIKNALPPPQNMRRSISAIHFKRLPPSELKNCFHRSSSVGENLNILEELDENDVSSRTVVASDRKKSVKFMTPNAYRTPRTQELKGKLKSWLVSKGKPLDSFHHLQCFGVAALSPDVRKSEEDNKENRETLQDNSFADDMHDRTKDFTTRWRNHESIASVNTTINDGNLTIGDGDMAQTPYCENAETVATAALKDLLKLVQEGFDHDQCARWLRAVRAACPSCVMSRDYWECRATLDTERGDLHGAAASWQRALQHGSEPAVADASLDQLLDKFMQLNIASDAKGKDKQEESRERKLLDVKNVFKSTLIKFAVKQAKSERVEYGFTATPVRRSCRLSVQPMTSTAERKGSAAKNAAGRPITASLKRNRTPLLQLCGTLSELSPGVANNMRFVPNKELDFSP